MCHRYNVLLAVAVANRWTNESVYFRNKQAMLVVWKSNHHHLLRINAISITTSVYHVHCAVCTDITATWHNALLIPLLGFSRVINSLLTYLLTTATATCTVTTGTLHDRSTIELLPTEGMVLTCCCGNTTWPWVQGRREVASRSETCDRRHHTESHPLYPETPE